MQRMCDIIVPHNSDFSKMNAWETTRPCTRGGCLRTGGRPYVWHGAPPAPAPAGRTGCTEAAPGPLRAGGGSSPLGSAIPPHRLESGGGPQPARNNGTPGAAPAAPFPRGVGARPHCFLSCRPYSSSAFRFERFEVSRTHPSPSPAPPPGNFLEAFGAERFRIVHCRGVA